METISPPAGFVKLADIGPEPPIIPNGKQGRWDKVGSFRTGWRWEFTERKELAPLPEPQFVFDRDKLTIKVRDLNAHLDLSAITHEYSKPVFLDDDGKEIQVPDDFLEKHGSDLRNEIEQAAWAVFVNRRFGRSLANDEDPTTFDVWETLDDGATLDWELGAIIEPQAARASTNAVPLFGLRADEDGRDELILMRWLCRGGTALVVGPTGVGKSSLLMQIVICMALGRPCFGFRPAKPLAVLVVQAENDGGDLCEQRDGIKDGLDLSEYEEALLNEMIAIATIDADTGLEFFGKLKKLIRDWQPDLVVIDPLNAFAGCDLSKQDQAAEFLRHNLNPILHRANVGCMIVHHTGKPSYKNGQQQELHVDYAGLGSSELSNWARAIVYLSVDQGDRFALTLGKRGKRAGIYDSLGATRVWLRHSDQGIFWEQVDAPAEASPKAPKTAESVLALVPVSPERILKSSLIEKAKGNGIGDGRARAFIDELVDSGKLHVHRQKRAGTNPAQYLARHPMPAQPELTNEK